MNWMTIKLPILKAIYPYLKILTCDMSEWGKKLNEKKKLTKSYNDIQLRGEVWLSGGKRELK